LREFNSGMGYATRLRDFGVEKSELAELAAAVKINQESEPRKLTVDDVTRIYEEAY